ncbi:ABC transporter ATP-binding protein/permease [Gammaproteobacteria bacterium]|nr:ABC transporter ATP-binding protein/permease [Gammaproteobacteria bacterium]
MIKTFSRILELIEKKQRGKFLGLAFLVLLMGLFEVIGVSSLIPFLDLVAVGNVNEIGGITKTIYEFLDLDNFNSFLYLTGISVLFLILVSNFLRALVLFVSARFVWKNQARMAIRLHTSILMRPYEEFSLENSAESAKDILVETERFVTGLMQPLLTIFSQIVICTSLIVVLCLYDLSITIIVVISTLAIFGIFSLVIHKPLYSMGRKRFEATEDRFQSVDEALSGIKLIKLMNKELFFAEQLKKPSFEFADAMAYMTVVRNLPRYIFEVIVFGTIIVLLLFSIGDGSNLQEMAPTLGLFAFAGFRLLPSVSQLYQAYNNLTFNSVVLDKLYMERKLSNDLPELTKVTTELEGSDSYSFHFEDVSFNYKSSDKIVLKDISLRLDSPLFIGVIGPTGSGKSTFIDLLLGLIEPSSGQIFLNNTLYNESLRNEMALKTGYVPQEVYLFDNTIAANIALGVNESDIDMSRIEAVARLADIDDFIINQLPDGYDSSVGERGSRLSGGQVQRIGIARALYNHPEILILDEGTSNLDQTTESKILKNIKEDKTIKMLIIIAHRLKATEDCDYLIFFKDGLITDQGTFKELSDRNLDFREMIKS